MDLQHRGKELTVWNLIQVMNIPKADYQFWNISTFSSLCWWKKDTLWDIDHWKGKKTDLFALFNVRICKQQSIRKGKTITSYN